MKLKVAFCVLVCVFLVNSVMAVAGSAYVQKTITAEQGSAACSAALEYARQGVYYKLGGQVSVEAFSANPDQGHGIDASGLVVNVFRSVLGDIRWAGGGGEDPILLADVSSSSLFNWNTLAINLDELQPGDLIFFKNSDGRITGVSVFVDRKGDLVHFVVPSASKGKVVETFLNIRNEYWQNQFAGAGRLTYWQR